MAARPVRARRRADRRFARLADDRCRHRAQHLRHALAGRGRHDQRRLLGGALEPRDLLLDLLRRQRVRLVERDDLGLVGEAVAIGFELGAHGLVGLAGVLAGAVDEMQQHAAALDMAEEAVAQAGAFMRAFDQAGNVGEHEFAAVDADHAELRMQRGERIVGDLRLGGAHGREERRLAGIGQADDAGIGDQLEAAAGWCAPRPAGPDWRGAARGWSRT